LSKKTLHQPGSRRLFLKRAKSNEIHINFEDEGVGQHVPNVSTSGAKNESAEGFLSRPSGGHPDRFLRDGKLPVASASSEP
jgi:hypothetical protein